MHPRAYHSLRIFVTVAGHLSLTKAATALNMTKGAVSYQIKQLEQQLGFSVFRRIGNTIQLSAKGQRLFLESSSLFTQMEHTIDALREGENTHLTIGMTTYFASRWLTPRLMKFTDQHQSIRLRLQPVAGYVDPTTEGLDIAVQWGNGQWPELRTELLFKCPAFPTGNSRVLDALKNTSLAEVLSRNTLLDDFEESPAWKTWFQRAGIPFLKRDNAISIDDPNVRVEAVISGQGIALNDYLIDAEISSGKLHMLSDIGLDNYGYYLTYSKTADSNPALEQFRDWIISEAHPEPGVR